MFLCLGLMGGGRMAKYTTFRPRRNTPLSPEVITSNWAYFTVATGTAYTVPADAEVTFNGADWSNASGEVPNGVELVVNGTFNTDTAGWALIRSTLITSGGIATLTNTMSGGTVGQAGQVITTVIGQTYKVAGSFVKGTAVQGLISAGTTLSATDLEFQLLGASGPILFTFVATTTETHLTIFNNTSVLGDTSLFDDISIQELTTGTPVGAKRWRMRFEASPGHDTLITKTAVLDGVNWPFAVTTHVEDDIEDVLFGGDTDVTLGGEDVIW